MDDGVKRVCSTRSLSVKAHEGLKNVLEGETAGEVQVKTHLELKTSLC